MVTNGATFYVAYGSLDGSGLAVPSGSPADVFDESGKTIEWSSDAGDDADFKQWWMGSAEPCTIESFRKAGAAASDR